MVRLDISDAAFVPGSTVLRPAWVPELDRLLAILAQEPAVLRLSYVHSDGDQALANKRLASLKGLLARQWKERGAGYRLDIEARLEASATRSATMP